MAKGVPFDVRLPENAAARAEAMRAFEGLRAQASDLPEMALGEINDFTAFENSSDRARMGDAQKRVPPILIYFIRLLHSDFKLQDLLSFLHGFDHLILHQPE